MPEADLDLLKDAARASGEIAKRYFQASPETWDKGDGAGPVTEADLEIDRMLKAELCGSRPDYGWLSEETEDGAARLETKHCFIIDPIDGTRAFIAGEKTFSHSLAVARDGQVIAAAVYVPLLDRMYAASVDSASTLNEVPIEPSGKSELNGASVLAAKPNMDPENWKGPVPPVKRTFRPSLAYRLCAVAQGRFDAMLTLRDCWEWDIAAGELIVRNAGGLASDRAGLKMQFNNPHPKVPGCLAAGPALHPLILDELR